MVLAPALINERRDHATDGKAQTLKITHHAICRLKQAVQRLTHANELQRNHRCETDWKVLGKSLTPMKKRTVERVCTELGIPTTQAIVMGDGANDLKMMRFRGSQLATARNLSCVNKRRWR